MRIRNLYDPPTLADHDIPTPWIPDGTTCHYERTAQGWSFTVESQVTDGTKDVWCWPPDPRPDDLQTVCVENADGSISECADNFSFRAHAGETTVFTRISGFGDKDLPGMLRSAGLPLVLAATDRPY